MSNPYVRNTASVEFKIVVDECNVYVNLKDSYQVKKFAMNVFEYYLDEVGIQPILVKNIKYYSYDCVEPPKKKTSKKSSNPAPPPKEYTTKKSKSRTVFVLKEGVV